MVLTINLIYLAILIIDSIQGLSLKVIPESVKILELNKKYVMESPTLNIRRYKRDGEYYINIKGYLRHTWGNNVTIQIILTEYLHNEYRPSFIQLEYKLCDFINKEPYIGGMLQHAGISCPIIAGELSLMNMTVQSYNFPNVFPFTKGGANVALKITDTGEIIARIEYHARFVHQKKS